jgi:hypothetical protein
MAGYNSLSCVLTIMDRQRLCVDLSKVYLELGTFSINGDTDNVTFPSFDSENGRPMTINPPMPARIPERPKSEAVRPPPTVQAYISQQLASHGLQSATRPSIPPRTSGSAALTQFPLTQSTPLTPLSPAARLIEARVPRSEVDIYTANLASSQSSQPQDGSRRSRRHGRSNARLLGKGDSGGKSGGKQAGNWNWARFVIFWSGTWSARGTWSVRGSGSRGGRIED